MKILFVAFIAFTMLDNVCFVANKLNKLPLKIEWFYVLYVRFELMSGVMCECACTFIWKFSI